MTPAVCSGGKPQIAHGVCYDRGVCEATREVAMTKPESKFVTGYDRYVVEKRTPDGHLDFSEPREPFIEATSQQICDHFFAASGFEGESASQEQIAEWYASQGFYYRVKTW